jgi:polyphosphate kinase
MNRNMLRRVELAWPVTDPVLRQRIIDECWWPTCTMAATPGIWGQTASTGLPGDGHHPIAWSQAALMARYADVERGLRTHDPWT